jgi:hypothetical protein
VSPRSTSPHPAYTPDPDLAFVEACGPELEAYLLSREVYWPLTQPKGDLALPRLTLGGLLLALQRLGAVERDLAPADAARLARSRSRIETERLRWAAGVGVKMAVEVRAHLNLWRAYIEELVESPARQADLYAGEVRQRAKLQLLRTAPEGAGFPEAGRREIEALDARLSRLFTPGPFVWATQLAPAFPTLEFWFLYGRPQNSQG